MSTDLIIEGDYEVTSYEDKPLDTAYVKQARRHRNDEAAAREQDQKFQQRREQEARLRQADALRGAANGGINHHLSGGHQSDAFAYLFGVSRFRR